MARSRPLSALGPWHNSTMAVVISASEYTTRVTGTSMRPVAEGKYSRRRLALLSPASKVATVSMFKSLSVNTPDTLVPCVSLERAWPSNRNVTSLTLEKAVSVCATAPTIRLSASALPQDSAALPRSTRARPSAMSRSKVVPSGTTVFRPILAAARSFSGLCTKRLRAALAMPSVLATRVVTGTRYPSPS